MSALATDCPQELLRTFADEISRQSEYAKHVCETFMAEDFDSVTEWRQLLQIGNSFWTRKFRGDKGDLIDAGRWANILNMLLEKVIREMNIYVTVNVCSQPYEQY